MRRTLQISIISGILILAVVLVGGCVWWAQILLQERNGATPALVNRNPEGAKRIGRAPTAPPDAQKLLAAVVVSDDLPPTTAGPALAICDPIATNAGSDTAAFGAGCTRWLQYALFNYPQLGQMMPWSEQERALSELGVPDLRLNAHQAQQLGSMVGYTHVAISTITGTPDRCTLTLQVYSVSNHAAAGPTWSVTGSEAQIVAALPHLTQQLLTRIAVHASAPPSPALNPDDLHTIGSYDWWHEGRPSPELQQRMQALKLRDALAGMLYMLHNSGREEDYRRIFSQAPTNLEAKAECLTLFNALPPALRTETVRNLPPLSDNYFVAYARLDDSHTPKELVHNAEHLVQCAPRNPAAWVILAAMYARVSDHLRMSRTADKISPEEWNTLHRLYAHWLSAAQYAATLDPQYGPAWTEIAIAGAFAGQPSVADTALWQAIPLDRGSSRPYWWGLEMYQPKWYDDAAKLDKVAKLALADTSLNSAGRHELAQELQSLGRVTEAQQMEALAKPSR
ncbi:MAG TPA: hypothetical protein VKU00_16780 [Chthonomonadaceae bacterium]|nr:hypothetical protein [Chthonomonadaceae bacterium]